MDEVPRQVEMEPAVAKDSGLQAVRVWNRNQDHTAGLEQPYGLRD